MNDPSHNELAEFRLRKAKETLNEVILLSDHEFWNAAINRMYYACFYAVTVLLLKHEIHVQTHAGVRSMFGAHFIKTGKIEKELGKFFSDLFDRRQSTDYNDFVSFNKEVIEDMLPLAQQLIEQIEKQVHEY